MFTSTMFASILPEILMLLLGILVLVVEPFWTGLGRIVPVWTRPPVMTGASGASLSTMKEKA